MQWMNDSIMKERKTETEEWQTKNKTNTMQRQAGKEVNSKKKNIYIK